MNIQRVELAVQEARRFLARAESWLKVEKESQANNLISSYYFPNPKESGALKRSSMDLTRALVPIREKRS